MTTPKKTISKAAPKAAKPAAAKASGNGPRLFQLKVDLLESEPPIWRQVLVPEDMTLDQLHGVIQIVMGWDGSHLHMFSTGAVMYAMHGDDDDSERPPESEHAVGEVLPRAKSKLLYEYDFGDSWMHRITLEKKLPPDPAFRHPVCLAGARACPPEDSGGVCGYYGLLEAMSNPDDPDHEWVIEEVLGEDFNPEAFDIDSVNRMLARWFRLRGRKKPGA